MPKINARERREARSLAADSVPSGVRVQIRPSSRVNVIKRPMTSGAAACHAAFASVVNDPRQLNTATSRVVGQHIALYSAVMPEVPGANGTPYGCKPAALAGMIRAASVSTGSMK